MQILKLCPRVAASQSLGQRWGRESVLKAPSAILLSHLGQFPCSALGNHLHWGYEV